MTPCGFFICGEPVKLQLDGYINVAGLPLDDLRHEPIDSPSMGSSPNLLVQNFLDVALKEKSKEMSERDWLSLEKRTCAAIKDCLIDSAFYSVLDEKKSKDL